MRRAFISVLPAAAGLFVLGLGALPANSAGQPKIGVRKAPTLSVDGLTFKDLNKNGVLDKYEDWRLPVDQRVADLVSKMTVEEKAGLMIHTSLAGFTGPNGEVLGLPATPARGGAGRGAAGAGAPVNRAIQGRDNPNNVTPMDSPNPNETILKRNIRWILVRPNAGEAPDITARFHNGLQEMAEGSRLGIPLVFSSDPRHEARSGAAPAAPNISLWPGQLGLAAIGDEAATREFARIAAQELRAIGIQCTLSPMADIASEPRWNRVPGTFGEDPAMVAKLTRAYIEGFQGKQLGPESVLTVVKHFPGDGPVKDGHDPHNSYGKYAIYPAGKFDDHLVPFKAAFEAGSGAVMGGYFIPVGKDTVAINFSAKMTDDLLRKTMGYQGMVVTDWLRNMPWGVESLSEKDRQKTMVLAGVDQIGGDNDPKYILENVKDGSVSQARLDQSARRVLTAAFQLGMFENPYVDPDRAKALVASQKSVESGHAAQVKSVVLLKNANNVLPAASAKSVYLENIDRASVAGYATVVDNPKEAALAIIKINTPAIVYPFGGTFFARGAMGPVQTVLGNTLAYEGSANQKELDAVKKLAATGTPVLVVVNMDRPAILTEFIDSVAAVVVGFSVNDRAVMDVVFGKHAPTGKLPYNLPHDMPSVMANAEDASHDIAQPLFPFGYGLTYPAAR
jgi:beta-glucosidase